MKTYSIDQTSSSTAIETVEIHFEGASLPTLTRWTLRSRRTSSESTETTTLPSTGGGSARRLHWNLPLMALSLALLRLESTRGRPSALLSGGRGTAAKILAQCFGNKGEAARLRSVLTSPDDPTLLERWFEVRRGGDAPIIWTGRMPPNEVIVILDGIRLTTDELHALSAKIEWMTEERDWLGSVVGRKRLAAVA